MRFSLCVLLLVQILLAACGGGGGGGAGPTPPLTPAQLLALATGTYAYVGISGEAGSPDAGKSAWGTLVMDGAGMVTGGSSFGNDNGAVSGPVAQGAIEYTVNDHRQLTFLVGGTPALEGAISADGRVASLAQITPGDDPGIFILVRKEGTHSNASLSGTYHLGSFFYDFGAMRDDSAWGSMSFGGDGTASGDVQFNIDGTVSSAVSTSLPHSVAADGTITATFASLELTGTVLAGGELIILAGSTTSTQAPSLLVLIKGAAGATPALFDGVYQSVSLEARKSPAPRWTSITGTEASNGVDDTRGSGSGTANEDGAIAPSTSGRFSTHYAVAADGSLFYDSALYRGAVSPTGRFAMHTGHAVGGNPRFAFLLSLP